MSLCPAVPDAPPSNTTGMALNSTHIYIAWDPPPRDHINGVIEGYTINITELDTGEMSQYISQETEATIGLLHPHYSYNFSIAAVTLAGNGPTTYVIVRTAEAGKLQNLFRNSSHEFLQTCYSPFQCSCCD